MFKSFHQAMRAGRSLMQLTTTGIVFEHHSAEQCRCCNGSKLTNSRERWLSHIIVDRSFQNHLVTAIPSRLTGVYIAKCTTGWLNFLGDVQFFCSSYPAWGWWCLLNFLHKFTTSGIAAPILVFLGEDLIGQILSNSFLPQLDRSLELKMVTRLLRWAAEHYEGMKRLGTNKCTNQRQNRCSDNSLTEFI